MEDWTIYDMNKHFEDPKYHIKYRIETGAFQIVKVQFGYNEDVKTEFRKATIYFKLSMN